MPRAEAQACVYGPVRSDTRRHEFAGAGAQGLDLIALHSRNDPEVDQDALARARAASVSMLQRAATLRGEQSGGWFMARVTNETGHKLPTGHIEGRRAWVNVRFLDASGSIVSEIGRYDYAEAVLDEASAAVFEMRVGLSDVAAGLTGLPAGETKRMAIADTIEKDTRIPPRGFTNEAFELGGAPVVGAEYADGQHWHDSWYRVPEGAIDVTVSLYYQNTPRWYIDHLKDHNHTDDWGDTLHNLWTQTGRGEPILMASSTVQLRCAADLAEPFGSLNFQDIVAFVSAYNAGHVSADLAEPFGTFNFFDLAEFIRLFTGACQ
jgi:hypothetical protein